MGLLVEAVWIRFDIERTHEQHGAVRKGCRVYLRWRHDGTEPDESAVDLFLEAAMESRISACWWFTSETGSGTASDKLLQVMRNHCEPTGIAMSGHLSC